MSSATGDPSWYQGLRFEPFRLCQIKISCEALGLPSAWWLHHQCCTSTLMKVCCTSTTERMSRIQVRIVTRLSKELLQFDSEAAVSDELIVTEGESRRVMTTLILYQSCMEMSYWIQSWVWVSWNGYNDIPVTKLVGFAETNVKVNHVGLQVYSDIALD